MGKVLSLTKGNRELYRLVVEKLIRLHYANDYHRVLGLFCSDVHRRHIEVRAQIFVGPEFNVFRKLHLKGTRTFSKPNTDNIILEFQIDLRDLQ